jgi:hypothetical protein
VGREGNFPGRCIALSAVKRNDHLLQPIIGDNNVIVGEQDQIAASMRQTSIEGMTFSSSAFVNVTNVDSWEFGALDSSWGVIGGGIIDYDQFHSPPR